MAGRLMKLVRDKFPEFTIPRVEFREMSEHAYGMQLRRKILEEATEWALEPSLEELADLYEVMRACAYYFHDGVGMAEVARVANEKSNVKGGFWEGIGMYGVRENGTD
jgi:predicted house-cleaning noncanonical NTP pyrophosphatase (MazG superfamily)